jgi:RNA polymerase sigma-70 factor (ECF subfamily)
MTRSTTEAHLRAPQRFEQQALPHLDAAYSLAFWLMRDRADAEDVVQDAYVRALRGFDGFRGEAMRPWLLAIVRNVAWRALAVRRRATNNVIPIEAAYSRTCEDDPEPMSIPSSEPSAETRLIEAGDRALLTRALDALTPLFREVLVLRELEEMSYGEIATVLGIPQGTVMSRLSRARAELRLRFKDLAQQPRPHENGPHENGPHENGPQENGKHAV